MEGRVQRWTSWAGGPRGLVAIALVQLAMAGLFVVEPRLCVAAVGAVLAALFVLEWPVLGVGMLLAARLLSTGALVFVRVGKIGIGPFEPALVLCVGALVARAALDGAPLWRAWPWRAPFLALAGWISVSLLWSVDRSDGLGDVLPLTLVLANALVILAFVRDWASFALMTRFWLGACVAIGVLTIFVDTLGIQVTEVTFKAAAGGGRETGLGQQPNWYAMNLMFVVLPALGMAWVEARRVRRVGLLLAASFVLFMMLKSGSRGSAYGVIIGALAMGALHPVFRRRVAQVGIVVVVLVGIAIAFDVGDSAKALTRISSNLSIQENYRPLNWLVCLQMFQDTWGRGIGVGGYTTLLPQYNNYLAQSLYDYPHGIVWEVMAHYGVLGLGLVVWLLVRVTRMAVALARWTRGTAAEIFAWTMPASMLGYVAWSFVEFTVAEKPFWEFLSLYTALYLMIWQVRARAEAAGGDPDAAVAAAIPAWSGLRGRA